MSWTEIIPSLKQIWIILVALFSLDIISTTIGLNLSSTIFETNPRLQNIAGNPFADLIVKAAVFVLIYCLVHFYLRYWKTDDLFFRKVLFVCCLVYGVFVVVNNFYHLFVFFLFNY